MYGSGHWIWPAWIGGGVWSGRVRVMVVAMAGKSPSSSGMMGMFG